MTLKNFPNPEIMNCDNHAVKSAMDKFKMVTHLPRLSMSRGSSRITTKRTPFVRTPIVETIIVAIIASCPI